MEQEHRNNMVSYYILPLIWDYNFVKTVLTRSTVCVRKFVNIEVINLFILVVIFRIFLRIKFFVKLL